MNDPLAAAPPPALPPVDLADPDAREQWLHDVRAHLSELTSSALEATGPKRRRILSRAEFRRSITEAGAALGALLDAADPPPDEPGSIFIVTRLPGHKGPDLFEQIDRVTPRGAP